MAFNTNSQARSFNFRQSLIRKNIWIIPIVFILSTFTMEGFGQTLIRGLALDESGERLGFANVLLRQEADSIMVKGAISREDGFFAFENVSAGSYFIELSLIGYNSSFSTSFSFDTEHTIDIGEIKIGALGRVLNEVQIVARKPLFEQKIDHLVVNVQNSITSAGTNALEALERSPGINVNQQSGKLSFCLLYTSPSPRDATLSRMPSSA